MKRVFCLDDGMDYFFSAISGYQAIQKMLYTLNLEHEDKNAELKLCNGRTWTLKHNGKIYACIK